MSPPARNSKPIDALGVGDLDAFPIWEFATDEESDEGADETWVRPLDVPAIPLGAYSLSVAATFTTASGTQLRGLVGITTAAGVEIGDGVLLADGHYLHVPGCAQRDAEDTYAEIAATLGADPKAVFPLAFKLALPLQGQSEPIEGVLPA